MTTQISPKIQFLVTGTIASALDILISVQKEYPTAKQGFEAIEARSEGFHKTRPIGFNQIIDGRHIREDEVDGIIEAFLREKEPFRLSPSGEVEAAKRRDNESLTKLILGSGAMICREKRWSFYNPDNDIICLPPTPDFYTQADMHYIEMHEMMHWTGHASRHDRHGSHAELSKAPEALAELFETVEEIIAEAGCLALLDLYAPKSADALRDVIIQRIATHYCNMHTHCMVLAMMKKTNMPEPLAKTLVLMAMDKGWPAPQGQLQLMANSQGAANSAAILGVQMLMDIHDKARDNAH